MTSDCPRVVNSTSTLFLNAVDLVYGIVSENARDQPAVLLKTSEAAGLSEMMVVASPVAVRSKVSVPAVVS